MTKAGSEIENINNQILTKAAVPAKLEKSSTSGFNLTKNQLLSSSTLASPLNVNLAATA
jgi:lambda repressor-like predicted transcriptional regulator